MASASSFQTTFFVIIVVKLDEVLRDRGRLFLSHLLEYNLFLIRVLASLFLSQGRCGLHRNLSKVFVKPVRFVRSFRQEVRLVFEAAFRDLGFVVVDAGEAGEPGLALEYVNVDLRIAVEFVNGRDLCLGKTGILMQYSRIELLGVDIPL